MIRTFLVAATAALVLGSTRPAAAGGGWGICLADTPAPPNGTVFVSDNCFFEPEIKIRAGEVIRWELRAASGLHTVTFDNGLDSGDMKGPFAVRFNESGTFAYYCRYHGKAGSGMAGTVKVVGPPRVYTGEPSFDILEGNPLTSADPSELGTPVALASPAADSRYLVARVTLDPAAAAVLLGTTLALGFGVGAGLSLSGRFRRRPG